MTVLTETLTRTAHSALIPRQPRPGAVYIIHFDQPFHHAQHYVGWTGSDDVNIRMETHLKGNGARLMRAVSGEGITWNVVRIFRNADRYFERWLKNQHRTADFCPVCNDSPRKIRDNGNT